MAQPIRPRVRSTYTVVELELSAPAFDEIHRKLVEAGYDHVIDEEGIDMTGIKVVPEKELVC